MTNQTNSQQHLIHDPADRQFVDLQFADADTINGPFHPSCLMT